MGKFDDFKREDEPKLTGKQRCVIIDAEATVSKSGNDMIVVTIRPSGRKFTVKDFIVKNDSFNRRMTAFFDAFPEITFGDFNTMTWKGAEGAVNLQEDKNGYLVVKAYVDAVSARDLPPFEGDKPEKQTLTTIDDEPEDDEMPF